MFLSISKDNSERSVNFFNKKMEFEEIHNTTNRNHYSNISFKHGYRKGANFQGVSVLILDIDGGYSIEEMKEKLDGYTYLITTTLHHQLSMKNGKAITPCDKYRLFLPLDKPITDPVEYKTVIKGLISEFKADPKCSDLGRFFYCNPNQVVHYG